MTDDEAQEIRFLRKRLKEIESVVEEYALRFGLTDRARQVLTDPGVGSADEHE